MRKENTSLVIKFTLIGVVILILILTLRLYFSDFNIGNKVGFGSSVTNLIK